jgi:hypothetical protein
VIDWDKVKTPVRPAAPPAPPEVVETCWRMRGPSGKVLACTICRDAAPGLEVRVGYAVDDLLKSQRVPDLAAARDQAATWRETVVAVGRFQAVED